MLHALKAGDAWTFTRPIRRGERIRAEARATNVELVEGEHAGRFILVTGEVEYRTADDELVASVTAQNFGVVAQGKGPVSLHYPPRSGRRYTTDEFVRIAEGVFAEERRGDVPRAWESVAVGDLLVPVVKGPLDQVDMVTHYAGAIGGRRYTACELRWHQWRAARSASAEPPTSPEEFAEVFRKSKHFDDAEGESVGMPGAYDNGGQRIGWMSHLVTNWMGDHGQLRTLEVQLRRPTILSDTTWCRGRVVAKSQDGSSHTVTVELWAENQDGETTTTGRATVELPSMASLPSGQG